MCLPAWGYAIDSGKLLQSHSPPPRNSIGPDLCLQWSFLGGQPEQDLPAPRRHKKQCTYNLTKTHVLLNTHTLNLRRSDRLLCVSQMFYVSCNYCKGVRGYGIPEISFCRLGCLPSECPSAMAVVLKLLLSFPNLEEGEFSCPTCPPSVQKWEQNRFNFTLSDLLVYASLVSMIHFSSEALNLMVSLPLLPQSL